MKEVFERITVGLMVISFFVLVMTLPLVFISLSTYLLIIISILVIILILIVAYLVGDSLDFFCKK